MIRGCTFSLAALLLAAPCCGQRSEVTAKNWEPLGLTGNGGMFAPAISPVDPRLMMLNCDMSGAYLSRDGGQHWRMIDQSQLRSSTRCRPAFHPTDAKVIFAAQGGKGMKVSRDGGEHWEPVAGEKGDSPHLGEAPSGPFRQMGAVPFFFSYLGRDRLDQASGRPSYGYFRNDARAVGGNAPPDRRGEATRVRHIVCGEKVAFLPIGGELKGGPRFEASRGGWVGKQARRNSETSGISGS